MPKINRIDHVAIIVEDIDSALVFWRDALGLELDHVEDIPSQEARVAFLPVGESDVELVQPTNPDSGIARYLDKRGPGMHHICLQVDDIGAMLARLKFQGVELINTEPIANSAGKQLAFIHPKSTHGVLVELYQLPEIET
jgi:methylmalonyl-CoA/ethylmalonyl-CoA epimerase